MRAAEGAEEELMASSWSSSHCWSITNGFPLSKHEARMDVWPIQPAVTVHRQLLVEDISFSNQAHDSPCQLRKASSRPEVLFPSAPFPSTTRHRSEPKHVVTNKRPQATPNSTSMPSRAAQRLMHDHQEVMAAQEIMGVLDASPLENNLFEWHLQ